MRQKLTLTLGTFMIAGGMFGASLTFNASGVSAQETDPLTEERSEAHEQMHTLMDGMMGEGFTGRLHAQMPGSEEMMEACASGMNGMDGMMNGGDNMNQMSPMSENQQED